MYPEDSPHRSRHTEYDNTQFWVGDLVAKGPWVDVRSKGARGDGVTDDTAAIQAAVDSLPDLDLGGTGFSYKPTLLFPGGDYLISNEVLFSDINSFTVIAWGARFHYSGAGNCFRFSKVNYPKWYGGQIYLDTDTVDVVGMYLTNTRYGIFRDIDIGAADATYDTLNKGIVLYAGAGGTTDVLYNNFDGIRLVRLGQALTLQTADAEATVSRVNANVFRNMKFHSTNGVLFKAASTNSIEGVFENQAAQLEFRDNTSDVGSYENRIIITYYGTNAYSNTSSSDSNSKYNWITDYHGSSSMSTTEASHLVVTNENIAEKIDKNYGGIHHESAGQEQVILDDNPNNPNLIPYSEDFGEWTATDLTVTEDNTTAPDGTTTADLLTQDDANGNVMAATAVLGDNLENSVWSANVWLKAAAEQYATVDLILYTGAADAVVVSRNVYVTTGWKNYAISRNWSTTPGAAYNMRLKIYPTRKNGGSTGALWAWGASINKGYPNNYQRTAGSVVVMPKFKGFEYDNSDASTSGAGEDDLKSTTIPSPMLGDRDGFRIIAAGTKTGANGDKTIKLHWGTSSWTVCAAANNQNDWRVEAIIFNTAVNAQRISWIGWDGATPLQGYETATIITCKMAGWAADPIVKITGECADAGDTITQTMWIVERL